MQEVCTGRSIRHQSLSLEHACCAEMIYCTCNLLSEIDIVASCNYEVAVAAFNALVCMQAIEIL